MVWVVNSLGEVTGDVDNVGRCHVGGEDKEGKKDRITVTVQEDGEDGVGEDGVLDVVPGENQGHFVNEDEDVESDRRGKGGREDDEDGRWV